MKKIVYFCQLKICCYSGSQLCLTLQPRELEHIRFPCPSPVFLLKNSHNLKVENYVYSVGIFRTSSPGDSMSSNPKRSAVRR